MRVFCSYAHADRKIQEQLLKHLSLLRNEGAIEVWHDGVIKPGADWAAEIKAALEAADLILLLVSAEFFSSYYCIEVEMRAALARHEDREALVVPIIAGPCDYKFSPLAYLQALPRDCNPIKTDRGISQERLFIISREIRELVESRPVRRMRGRTQGHALPRRPPVRGLVYLCNRTAQEYALEEAFAAHRKTSPRRPFICVVHGDERERHDGFLTRLRSYTLPRILGKVPGDELGPFSPLSWPRPLSHEPSPGMLDSMVATALGCSRDRIYDEVTADADSALLFAELSSADWPNGGQRLLESFLEYWSGWPDLRPDRNVVVCLLIKYLVDPDVKSIGQIRQALAGISFPALAQVGGVVLPELRPIHRSDAAQFGALQAVQRAYNRCISLPEWTREVEELFWGHDELPMSLLAEPFALLLETFATEFRQ
jgi:hypothetical protein